MNDFSKKRWGWMLIGWTLLSLIFNFGAGDLWAAQTDQIERDLSRKKRELRKINKELHQKKVKEKEMQKKESSIFKRYQQVSAKLHQKEKELKKMKVEASRIQRRLDQTRNKIVLLNKRMEETRGKLVSRLNAFYKLNRIPSEIFIPISESYSDFLKMDKYLRDIIDSDARLMDTYRHQLELKERYRENLIQEESQWERSISKVEKKRSEIKKVRWANRKLLQSVKNQRKAYQEDIGKLEERVKGLQDLIDKLGREKKLLAYKKSKHKPFKGKIIPPVYGKVISLFKENGQNGIEIKAPIGTEIRAVHPGKILYADWFKGYGNVVIIDHGDHFFTVSAYCSQLLKKVGDNVSRGESIARVGSENPSREPSLYFEIRHRGKPQDPMKWIPNFKKN
jgi:septal ring factor EnvC (AmiA/AmiB activator)